MALTVVYIFIEECDICCYDALSIYDGPSSSYRSLARLCGYIIPGTILSSGNQVYLTFKSDVSVIDTGFRVEVKEENFGKLKIS